MTSNELQHDKTNNMTYAPSEESDQPAHSPSLIRVFAKHSVVSLGPKRSADSEDSGQTGQLPRLICLRWAHRSFCWFFHEAAHIWAWAGRGSSIGSVSAWHASAPSSIPTCGTFFLEDLVMKKCLRPFSLFR